MKKVSQKIFIILIIVSLLIPTGLGTVFADDAYRTFRQGNYPNDYIGSSSYTVARTGCAITSITILMAYANPDLRDSTKWNPAIAAQSFTFSDDNIYWGSTTNVDPTFTCKQWSSGTLSIEEIKAELDAGNYVVYQGCVYSGWHYSPIVGWDTTNNLPILWDVAGSDGQDQLSFMDFYNAGSEQCVVYESSLNKSYDVFEGGKYYTTTNHSSEESKRIQDAMVDEWDLTGMPSNPYLLFKEGDEGITLPDGTELSASEKETLGQYKETLELNLNSKIYHICSIVLKIFGFLICIYGFCLLACFVFDKINVFFEVQLLEIITLGRLRVYQDGYEGITPNHKASDGKTYVNTLRILILFFICEIVGLCIISNTFIKYGYLIYKKVRTIILRAF